MGREEIKVSPNSLCQIEIKVGDIEKALSFYKNTFGWESVPAHIHNYFILDVPKDCPFGISLLPGKSSGSTSSRVVLYFKSADPESIVKLACENGGKKVLEKNIPGYGHIFQIADPDGQLFGLWACQEKK